MDYSNDPSGTAGTNGTLNNERPNQHDYEHLATIYGHADSSTTVGQRTNPGANGPGRAGDPQWGLLVRTTNGGRTQLFEKDLGGGQKVFTFVIWADAESASLDDDGHH